MNFEGVLAIALKMPDVRDATTARGFALTLKGKLLACKAIKTIGRISTESERKVLMRSLARPAQTLRAKFAKLEVA